MAANIILSLTGSMRRSMANCFKEGLSPTQMEDILAVIKNIEYQVFVGDLTKESKQSMKDLKTRLGEAMVLMSSSSLEPVPWTSPSLPPTQEPNPSPPKESWDGAATDPTVLEFLAQMDKEELELSDKKRKNEEEEGPAKKIRKPRKKVEKKKKIKNLPPPLILPAWKYGAGKTITNQRASPPPIGTGTFEFPPMSPPKLSSVQQLAVLHESQAV